MLLSLVVHFCSSAAALSTLCVSRACRQLYAKPTASTGEFHFTICFQGHSHPALCLLGRYCTTSVCCVCVSLVWQITTDRVAVLLGVRFVKNLNFLVGVPMFHALKAGALDEVLQQLRLLTDLAPGAVIEPSHTAWQMLIDHRWVRSNRTHVSFSVYALSSQSVVVLNTVSVH